MADCTGTEECILTDEQYTAVCEWAAQGDLERVERFIEDLSKEAVRPEAFTPYNKLSTGFPDTPCQVSPLILAAQNGHLKVVEYLVNQFPEASFVDHVATISFSWGSQLHHCTALNAASISGHVDIARLLLRTGASHDIVDCTGSTPFCEATYHGHLEVMKCLHKHGADINTPNVFGWNPLHVAAAEGNNGCEMVSHLLEMGAERGRKTPQGYTVLHVAAAKGRLGIVKFLLQKGLSLDFSEADLSNPDYVPCPLYLAAASGFSGIVSHFTQQQRPNISPCPPACEYDALLLLAAKSVESTILRSKHWKRAFDLRLNPDSDIFPNYPPPISAYGGRTELISYEEFNRMTEYCRAKEMVGNDSYLSIEMLYQALIIRERCIGEKDPQLFSTLTQLSKQLIMKCFHKEAELLLFRAIELTETYQIEELDKGYILPQTIESEIGRWMEHSLAPALLAMSSDREFIPSFGQYITFGLKLLEAIQERDRVLMGTYGCKRNMPKYLLETILLLFKVWLYCNTQPKACSRSIEDCEQLGRKLVTEWMLLKNGSTLLHLAVSAPRELEGLFSYISEYSRKEAGVSLSRSLAVFYAEWSFDSLLTLALLKWGAHAVINRRDNQENSNLPLHMVVQRLDKTVGTKGHEQLLNILLSHGAHSDALNAEGKLPWDMCQNAKTRAEVREILCGPPCPPALACQAAHRVISEGLLYEKLPIAPRLKAFIRLHDRDAAL